MRFALIPALLAWLPSVAQSAPTVTIDPTIVLRTDARNPLGINVNYLTDHESLRPGNKIRTLTQAIADSKVGYVRFPGGEKSDNYLWSTPSHASVPITRDDAVPTPLRPRLITPALWPGTDPRFITSSDDFVSPTLDFDAFIAQCQANGTEPVIVVAYDSARELSGNPTAPTLAQLIESAAAWVHYANITRRYQVKYWEIGNESWFIPGQTAAKYADHVAQFAPAMRAVDPTIRIGAHGHGSGWWNTLLARAGDTFDWLSVHDYPTYQWTTGYRTSPQDLTTETDLALRAIGKRLHTIGVTEINAIDWEPNGWNNVNDTGHALAVFDMIGQQLLTPKVSFVQLWNTRWIHNFTYHSGNASNLVPNGGFEKEIRGWSGRGGTRDTTTPRSGTHALALTGGAFLQRPVPNLKPGNTYTLRGWSRTTTKAAWSAFGLDCFAGDKKTLSIYKTATSPTWAPGTVPFTVPPGTTAAYLWVSTAAGNHTTHFDDIVLDDSVEPTVNDAYTSGNAYLPVGRAFALWSEFIPSQLVQATGTPLVTAYAGIDPADRTLTVWLLNRHTTPQDITLELAHYTPAPSADRWVFQGTSPEDYFPAYKPLPPLNLHGPDTVLTLPSFSITVLRVSPKTQH